MRFRLSASTCALLTVIVLTSFVPVPAAAAEDPPGWVVDRVRFEPAEPGPGPFALEEIGAYQGAIEVVPSGGGLAVINDVGLQDYVKGIAEVSSSWPTEALRAQAIAARTYALNQKDSTAPSPWKANGADICNTDSCQVYVGLAKTQGQDGDAWAAAVDDTAGQVLLYNGRPIFAQYSASNGGQSVQGSQPYLQSVDDPDDASTAVGRWEWGTPLASLAPLLNVPPEQVLTGVGRDGGSIAYAVKGIEGGTAEGTIGADELRARVNVAFPAPDGLPSPLPGTDYGVATDGDNVIFSGGGWGHGVGMSQYGALVKAQRGMSADEILAEYYGGITPETLDADQLASTIRVEVASGKGSVTVKPGHYFRMMTGAGTQIAGIETGTWRVVPASGGVRVIPPDGWAPLSLRKATVDPPAAIDASPVVHYDLSAPAMVTVRYVTPAGVEGSVPARLVDVGEVAESLPPPAQNGDYKVVIEAVSGPESNASAPLDMRIGDPERVRVEPSDGPGGLAIPASVARPAERNRIPWILLALLLVVGTSLAGRRVSRLLAG